MSLAFDVFWSFRSPYSYLATPRLDGEPFFGQDRIELLLWRMRQHGLRRHGA